MIPVVTIANYGYIHYMENLRESIRRCGITDLDVIVLCMDTKTAEYCKSKSIPYFVCNTNVGEEFFNWKTHDKAQVNKTLMQKLDCLIQFMDSNKSIEEFIYMDGDIVVFKDFRKYIQDYSKTYDIVFQCDEWNTIPDCSGRARNGLCKYACTGFMYIKNRVSIKTLFNYHLHMNTTEICHDQEYVNWVLKTNKSIPWTTFPRNTIPNGSFRNSNLSEAYILHYNFLSGNDKQNEMISHGHWFVNDTKYDL